MKVLIINRQNNMGDAICLMRGIKEWKDRTPGMKLDYASSHVMHLEAAFHTTGLFDNIEQIDDPTLDSWISDSSKHSYDLIKSHFNMDWTDILRVGFVNSYCEKNFGFIPTTNKPLFRLHQHEIVFAKYITDVLSGTAHWNSVAFLLPFAGSNWARSILFDDIHAVCSLFPEDCAILMPCGVHDPFHKTLNPFPPNVIVMPGLPIGVAAALLKYVDVSVMVHGAYAHIAYALDVKNVIQLNFYSQGSKTFEIPNALNLHFEFNNDDYMPTLKTAIDGVLNGI